MYKTLLVLKLEFGNVESIPAMQQPMTWFCMFKGFLCWDNLFESDAKGSVCFMLRDVAK